MNELETLIEGLKESHPEVVAEIARLQLWVATCIGAEIAAIGGPAVD